MFPLLLLLILVLLLLVLLLFLQQGKFQIMLGVLVIRTETQRLFIACNRLFELFGVVRHIAQVVLDKFGDLVTRTRQRLFQRGLRLVEAAAAYPSDVQTNARFTLIVIYNREGRFDDALRIVERGDIAPQDLRGAWAGEIGQTQFMPSSYLKFAVDFDNNSRRDLLRSVPDVLASTANFLANYGWQRGKDWVPGSPNFNVLQQWNKSDVYAKTVATFATQLAHTP